MKMKSGIKNIWNKMTNKTIDLNFKEKKQSNEDAEIKNEKQIE